MALRPPRALRGWWRYSRLVGAQLAVLAVAAGSSVLRAAGVADRPGPEWTTLAVTTAVRLMSRRLPCGAASWTAGRPGTPPATLPGRAGTDTAGRCGTGCPGWRPPRTARWAVGAAVPTG